MTEQSNLAGVLVERLRSYTHDRMPEVGRAIGLEVPEIEDGVSKRDRARKAFAGKSERELAELARRLGVFASDYSLEDMGLRGLEEGSPPVTEITRRDLAKCFGSDLAGEQNTVEMLKGLFAIDRMSANDLRGSFFDFTSLDVFEGRSLAVEIDRHMDLNPGDWQVEYLFDRIGALQCSRDRFGRLLEASVHPLARRGSEQLKLVDALNEVLKRDGYCLREFGEESGHAKFVFSPLSRGVPGRPKNIIFASNGPKPEIGFSDAINNDIVLLSNAENCLVYDRVLKREGLRWRDLVAWWVDLNGGASDDPARDLGARLHSSLASNAEKNLFISYFQLYRPKLGDQLPALVPQVYLHYDPAVVSQLRHRQGLVRQRMDFLLLLPNGQRIVIEVDGSQHFSEQGQPSLRAYAEMVSADRDLRLFGYEIYRFGANELVGAGAGALIAEFFDRLWKTHNITNS